MKKIMKKNEDAQGERWEGRDEKRSQRLKIEKQWCWLTVSNDRLIKPDISTISTRNSHHRNSLSYPIYTGSVMRATRQSKIHNYFFPSLLLLSLYLLRWFFCFFFRLHTSMALKCRLNTSIHGRTVFAVFLCAAFFCLFRGRVLLL